MQVPTAYLEHIATRMRWATCKKWEAKFDAAEGALDAHLVMAAARLMKRL